MRALWEFLRGFWDMSPMEKEHAFYTGPVCTCTSHGYTYTGGDFGPM